MLTEIQEFIRRQGLWLLLLWILREIMNTVWQGYWSSRVSWPSNSDTMVPQAMLVETTTVLGLEALLFAVSIVTFLLWLSVVEKRRELVRLQSHPPGQAAESETLPMGTSTSLECLGKTSTTARHSRSNSSGRPNSERASSEDSIANVDRRALTDSLAATPDEYILVEPSQTAGERESASCDKDTSSTDDIQTNHARHALDGDLLENPTETVSQENPSRASDQQLLRDGIMTTSSDRASRANRQFGTDKSLEKSEVRTKRKHLTIDLGRAPQGRNDSHNQSTQRTRTRTRTRRSSGNAPKEQKQAGREQTLQTRGNAGKNNRRKERVGQPHSQHGRGFMPSRDGSYRMLSTAPLHPTAQQQPQPTPLSCFLPQNVSQDPWSNGQTREPSIASSCYQEDYAYPQMASSHQLYANQTFRQSRYTRNTDPKHLLIDQQPTQRGRSRSRGPASAISEVVQPMDQAFTSATDWARNDLRPTPVNAPDHPLIVGPGARTLSPISYGRASQLLMQSNGSPSVVSVTTTTISTTNQGAELISEGQELSKGLFEPDIIVGGPDELVMIEHVRCESTPAHYSVDLELGMKPLNRTGTFPQGSESHIYWRTLDLPDCEEEGD